MSSPEAWRPWERTDFSGPALLDTHVWVWYLDGVTDRLSASAIELVRACARGEGVVVSDISVWEIAVKAAKGKLALAPTVEAWVERALRRPGFSFMPLDRAILLGSTRLPGEIQGDPADRMLVAAAMLSGIPLLTADQHLVDYAAQERGFAVCDVRRDAAGEAPSGSVR